MLYIFCIKRTYTQHNKDSAGSYLKQCNIFLSTIIMCSNRLLETQQLHDYMMLLQ